jgi:hypothetical protein
MVPGRDRLAAMTGQRRQVSTGAVVIGGVSFVAAVLA